MGQLIQLFDSGHDGLYVKVEAHNDGATSGGSGDQEAVPDTSGDSGDQEAVPKQPLAQVKKQGVEVCSSRGKFQTVRRDYLYRFRVIDLCESGVMHVSS